MKKFIYILTYRHWNNFKRKKIYTFIIRFVYELSILFINHLIHSLIFILIVLISINVFKFENVLFLIIKSIELLISCIYFIFVIFHRLYNCRKFITFIMKHFFCVMSSFLKNRTAISSQYKISKIRNDRESQIILLWKQNRDRNRELIHTIQLRERFELRFCIWLTINKRC